MPQGLTRDFRIPFAGSGQYVFQLFVIGPSHGAHAPNPPNGHLWTGRAQLQLLVGSREDVSSTRSDDILQFRRQRR